MPTLPGHVCGGVMCGLRELVEVQMKDVSRRENCRSEAKVDQETLTKQLVSVDAVRSGWAVASSG